MRGRESDDGKSGEGEDEGEGEGKRVGAKGSQHLGRTRANEFEQDEEVDEGGKEKLKLENSPSIHVFHADADMRIRHERSVEAHDVYTRAIVHDLKFSKDLLSNRGFGVDEDELSNDTRRGGRTKGQREVSLSQSFLRARSTPLSPSLEHR